MPKRIPWRLFSTMAIVAFSAAAALAQQDAIHERMKTDLFFLASEECEGRGVETQGIHKAADYIAKELQFAGLKPAGLNGSFFQPFSLLESDGQVEGDNTLALTGPLGQTIELKSDQDFKVLPLSATAKAETGIVFAGYGLTVPAANYDDFQGVDVKGKIVIVLRRVPRWDNEAVPFGGNKEQYAGFEGKIGNCESHAAAAVILVNDRSETGDKFMASLGAFPAGVPVVQLRRSVLDMMLVAGLGKTLTALEQDIDRDLKPRSEVIAGWKAKLTTTVKRSSHLCKNVIGVMEGAGPLAKETVVIGAHYDHLGYGGRGSLAKDKSQKQIHPGADDNASGTTAVLELARRFGAMKNRQGRRLVFILFSGEERGLFGSKHYCNKEPLFPLDNTVAMVNLDMVGRLAEKEPKLKVEGVGTGKGLKEVVEKIGAGFDFQLQPINGGLGPSDHDSFCRKKIPVLYLWTGTHSDYHRPSDLPDRINIAGMIKVTAFTEKAVAHFAANPVRYEFVAVAEPPRVGGGGQGGKLRIVPDYADESNKGMLIESVVENGAGAKGGIQAGDRLLSVNGQPTPNVNAYMTVMQRQKPGLPIDVVVERKGKEMKLKVTPE